MNWRKRPAALVVGCLVGLGWLASVGWCGAANDLVARGKAGVVVSPEPLATQVGLDVLAAGGNAVDAAVSIALTLAVTHPQAGNLGGGGFLLVLMADGRTAAIDFRERAPAAAHRDLYLRADGSVDLDRAQFGPSAAGVPGSPAGLALALQRLGSLPLQQLAQPAIALARDGFVVDQFLAGALHAERKNLARYPSTKQVFFVGERPLQQGERLVQKDLAATLTRYAEHGKDGFYRGPTADLIVAAMHDGGCITLADLAAYQVKEREPLRGTYRGYEVLGMPPPSSGGVALQEMLNLLEPFDLQQLGYGGSKYLHLLTEVMRRAYADRSQHLGDPDFAAVPVAGLVSKAYARQRSASLAFDRRSEVAPGQPPAGKDSDDTLHFSVVDKLGNAVACTTTINSTFGSMCVVPGAGFLLNNEMDDFSAKPGTPNQFGLIGGEANAIAPHKRMLSSMTPTIVRKDGELRLVLGAPGGGRIITGVLQVLLHRLDFGMSLEQAVRAGRIHHQWAPDLIDYEAHAVVPDVRAALQQLGHQFASQPRGIAQVMAIEVQPDGLRIGVADHRSGGSAGAN